ncbi:MAG: HipA domain-containing protein [Deltaproteobacteria bacterium]|nr:HipA domain-containing protein [Deltaproteobacteria bacterium]
MNKCPITYAECGSNKFSAEGLKKISAKLSNLKDLPLDTNGLRQEAMLRATRLSIQGVQPKLSAKLNIRTESFEIVDAKGKFILKPQADYPELPENEDLTMHLAEVVGFDVPVHGLIYAHDQSMVYFIERFDRLGHNKIATEDFAQLAGANRETKYAYSMERLVGLIEKFCTFPVVEKSELFKRTIFSYLIGNEDMHLKNFSLITRDDIVRLSPVYDFVNSSIVLRDPEELALPLNGKKRGITRKLLLEYYGLGRLGLGQKVIDDHMQRFSRALPVFYDWIEKSFLSAAYREKYKALVNARATMLQIT